MSSESYLDEFLNYPQAEKIFTTGFSTLASLATTAVENLVQHSLAFMDPSELVPDLSDFAEENKIEPISAHFAMSTIVFISNVIHWKHPDVTPDQLLDNVEARGLLRAEDKDAIRDAVQDRISPMQQRFRDNYARGESLSGSLPLLPDMNVRIDMRIALSANVRDTVGLPLNSGGQTLARRIDGKTRAET